MSDSAEKQADSKGKQGDAEVEDEVILADGFAVVDDVKTDEPKGTKEDSSTQKSTSEKTTAEPGKASGDTKTEKAKKEKEDAKTEPKVNGEQSETNPSSTKKPDGDDAVADKKTGAESKEEKTTQPKSEEKSLSESKDETLVITAEEDIDVAENDETKKTKAKSPVVNGKPSKGKPSKGKPRTPPSMWVSNIARKIKATDLKRVFSKHGRVVTAKIVTNGKSYFGYVCMDSTKSIERCIKYMNHTRLGDKKITISSERPDAPKKKGKETGSPAKKDTKEESDTKEGKEKTKKTEADKKSEDDKPKKDAATSNASKDSSKPTKPVRKRIEAPPKRDETILLKQQLRRVESELERTKRRLSDEEASCRTLLMRAKRFERGYKDLTEKLRQEKKAYEREKESLIKKNRVEQIKLDTERDLLEKDRSDLRRRRDDLEREMRKLNDMQRAAAERSHRPSRKSRSLSPPPPRSMQSASVKRMKTSDLKHDAKKARWSGDRTRTPPPPPKLTPVQDGSRSKRDHDSFYEDRAARRDTAVYVPTGGYHEAREGRHRAGFPPETKSAIVVPSRSSWANNSMPSEQWRGPPGDAPSGYGERFRGDPYRAPSGGYSGQSSSSRNEVHPYSHSRVSESSRGEPEYRRPVHYDAPPRKY